MVQSRCRRVDCLPRTQQNHHLGMFNGSHSSLQRIHYVTYQEETCLLESENWTPWQQRTANKPYSDFNLFHSFTICSPIIHFNIILLPISVFTSILLPRARGFQPIFSSYFLLALISVRPITVSNTTDLQGSGWCSPQMQLKHKNLRHC